MGHGVKLKEPQAKVCLICYKRFESRWTHQKYCSAECRAVSYDTKLREEYLRKVMYELINRGVIPESIREVLASST
jgi:hypothetical protein